jgi:BirA family transcriptional regulator, biotin operon repressor / biotin---[acetyl-CoA-carboxylase] ligase
MNFKEIDIPVLLYLSDKKYITGERLSKHLGISRVAVWKQIQKVKKLGYHIAAGGNKGYIIISRPDILLSVEIQSNLHTRYIGKQIYYYDRVDSTNSVAKDFIKDKEMNLQEGTVIIANEQSAGRGRLGRTWHSPHGGIWISIVLFPDLEPAYISKITLMTAVVLIQSLKALFDIPVLIKWPNDIIIEDKKLCGILTEMSAESDKINYVVVGIGINANIKIEKFPKEIQGQSTSLEEILGKQITKIKLTQLLFENFEKYYDLLLRKQFSTILKEWKLNAQTLGKRITIISGEQSITGEAVDITTEGALVIKTEDGNKVQILSGTVQ